MNSSFIPLPDHGPNRLAHDETPYPPTRSWVLFYYMGPPFFLLRSLLLLSRGSLGEESQGFILLDFVFCQLLLPSGTLAPSSHKIRYNPMLAWQTRDNVSILQSTSSYTSYHHAVQQYLWLCNNQIVAHIYYHAIIRYHNMQSPWLCINHLVAHNYYNAINHNHGLYNYATIN